MNQHPLKKGSHRQQKKEVFPKREKRSRKPPNGVTDMTEPGGLQLSKKKGKEKRGPTRETKKRPPRSTFNHIELSSSLYLNSCAE